MIGIILQRLFAVWLAVTLTFFALRLTASDAITAQLTATGADPDLIERRKQEYGLDQPLLAQYGHYMIRLIQGDAGISLTRQIPVTLILSDALGATIILAIPTLILSTIIGIGIGVLAGLSAWTAGIAHLWIGLSVSIPPYWSGTLTILLFSVLLRWLPASGTGDVRHMILPVGVLTFHTSGSIARVVQSGIRQMLTADFVRTARARGLPDRRVLIHYILRVSLLPVITVIGLQSGFVLGGTVITEILFVRPGLGRVLLEATLRRDYPVVQTIVVLSAIIYAILSTMTDLLVRWLDPRIRIPG